MTARPDRTFHRVALVCWSAAVLGWSLVVWMLRRTEPTAPPVVTRATAATPVPHSPPRCTP